MPETITREKIIETAVALLRRHGPTKVTVSDVARALNMSHGNVYRHFASKAALFDAIAERWLATVSDPLAAIAAEPAPASERLTTWVLTLMQLKLSKLQGDPELFAVYHAVTEQAREVVARHIALLIAQIAQIIGDGIQSGEFQVQNPTVATEAIWQATQRFHNPTLLTASAPPSEAQVRAVIALLLAGLRSGAL